MEMVESRRTKFRDAWTSYKIVFMCLIVFVLSLPFTGIEWDLFHVPRFEVKITMVTFLLLFIAFLWNSFKFPRKRSRSEKLFYTFAFLYGASQFISLVNSPMPAAVIKQGIIMGSLMVMMVVISETLIDRRIAVSVLTAIGTLSLVIGIIAVINYYLFTDWTSRLGQKNALGIINLRGDTVYFGDILLYSISGVVFVISNLSRKKYWKWARWLLLFLWFSAMVLTFTKGVLLAVICFFLCLFFILKGKRSFVAVTLSIFITAMIVNPIIVASGKAGVGTLLELRPKTAEKSGGQALPKRLNVLDVEGLSSVSVRQKCIVVSVKNSLKHFWFGHGAGLSQTLLPDMGDNYDKNVDAGIRECLKSRGVYGEIVNRTLIGSHALFLTEFFNVGIVGAISLICLVGFVVTKQVRILKTSCNEIGDINKLLFAVLIAMLVYRMTGSLVVIPFLWFILGLSFGVSKLCANPAKVNEVER